MANRNTSNTVGNGYGQYHDEEVNDNVTYSHYTQPMKIPGASQQPNDPSSNSHNNFNFTSLSASASTSPRSWFPGRNYFRPNNGNYHYNNQHHHPNQRLSQWGTEGLLSCSPMVTAPRKNIHLPDLKFREALKAEWADDRAASLEAARLERQEEIMEGDDARRGSDGFLGNSSSSSCNDGDGTMKRVRSRSLGDVRSPLLGNSKKLQQWFFNSNQDQNGLGGASKTANNLFGNSNKEDDFAGNQQEHEYEHEDMGYYGSTTTSALSNGAIIHPGADSDAIHYVNSPLEKNPALHYDSNETHSAAAAITTDTTETITIDTILREHEREIPIYSPSNSKHHQNKVIKRSESEIILHELETEFSSQSNSPLLSFLYGLVNSSIILPILMSFGSIIYHDDFFRPYLSILMKLTVISGAVHQITFSTVSSLPFAVGQVQDAGLIFLSAMARDLVSRCRAAGYGDSEYILATTTIGLSLCTALLGGALILVGKFKLAQYCQLLPSSVVGGYLAFIGFFCGQAGLALMASVDVTGLMEWYKFFDREAMMHLMPGVVGGLFIYFAVGKIRHMAVLPTCICLLLMVFYFVLWVMGMSVKDAIDDGWINEPVESPSWNHTWDFLRIDKVVWRVLPSQALTLIAMTSVVALSSSLDIAAIEIELKRPLNYNHELKTVGISNIVSGLTGGYTGSYIFSQTIFSLRTGIRSRLMGYVIAFLSVVVVVIPFNVLSYIPNFFFGSLLIMICLDLMFEWLIDVKSKVTPAEYIVVLSTFAFLQVLGVEFGVLAGVLLYVLIQKMGYDVGNDDKPNNDDVVSAKIGSPII